MAFSLYEMKWRRHLWFLAWCSFMWNEGLFILVLYFKSIYFVVVLIGKQTILNKCTKKKQIQFNFSFYSLCTIINSTNTYSKPVFFGKFCNSFPSILSISTYSKYGQQDKATKTTFLLVNIASFIQLKENYKNYGYFCTKSTKF